MCVQVQIEEAILTVRQERLKKLAEQCEVDLAVFDETVQPIIDSCTKDAIMVSCRVGGDHCMCVFVCADVCVCSCVYILACVCVYLCRRRRWI